MTSTTRGKAARSRILEALADGAWHTATQVQEITGLSQSTISNHLFVLTRPYLGRRPQVEMEQRPNPRRDQPRHGVPLKVNHYRLRKTRR